MIYLVKSGENTFEYEKICDEISLLILNPIIRSRNFPGLTGNDIQMLRNSGGTLVCKAPGNIMIWLINLEHEQDKEIGVILGDELLDITNSLRNTIKRDLTINKIIN